MKNTPILVNGKYMGKWGIPAMHVYTFYTYNGYSMLCKHTIRRAIHGEHSSEKAPWLAVNLGCSDQTGSKQRRIPLWLMY